MLILYMLLIVLGFVPFIITLFKWKQVKRMRRHGVKTTATVKEIYGRSAKGMNKVLIEFTLETRQLASQVITVGGMPYSEGDQLPLIYERDDPAKNILDPGSSYIIIIVFTLLLALFVLFACYKIQHGIETGEY